MTEELMKIDLLQRLVSAINYYREEHSRHEAGEVRSEYNDSYANLLRECDLIEGIVKLPRSAQLLHDADSRIQKGADVLPLWNLLEGCFQNGLEGQEKLYSWYLKNQDEIESVLPSDYEYPPSS